MASYNNHYGNIIYSRFGRRLSELITDSAISGNSVDQRAVLYYDTKDNIAHCAHYVLVKAWP